MKCLNIVRDFHVSIWWNVAAVAFAATDGPQIEVNIYAKICTSKWKFVIYKNIHINQERK